MIRSSREDNALAEMRAANPFSVEELRQTIDEADLARAMQRAIAIGDSPERPVPVGERAIERALGGRVGFFSKHRAATTGLGLAVIAAVAVLIVLGGGTVDSVKDGGRPTYAAAAVKVAKANPRLLVTAPGWSIVHANFQVEDGGLTYRHIGHPAPSGLVMYWAPAALYQGTLRDSRRSATATTSIVLGRRATTFHEPGRPAYTTVLPPQGKVFVTLALPAEEHEMLLRSLRAVGVERWLAAMPPEVVRPAAESGVVAQMLHGVPLPPGFDAASFEAETELSNRYELGEAVAGTVACGWLASWDAATRSGDGASSDAAVAAMHGSRHWPVLLQMVREKGFHGSVLPAHGNAWPSNVIAAAREIAHGHLRRGPDFRVVYRNGRPWGKAPTDIPINILGCS